jgi:hypothetical protein
MEPNFKVVWVTHEPTLARPIGASRARTSTKIQAPNTREAPKSKLQIPNKFEFSIFHRNFVASECSSINLQAADAIDNAAYLDKLLCGDLGPAIELCFWAEAFATETVGRGIDGFSRVWAGNAKVGDEFL